MQFYKAQLEKLQSLVFVSNTSTGHGVMVHYKLYLGVKL